MPLFVAVMVWLIRVLIISTISMAGGRLFSQQVRFKSSGQLRSIPTGDPAYTSRIVPTNREPATRITMPSSYMVANSKNEQRFQTKSLK